MSGPLAYDTGLPGPQRTLVRNAIADRLAPLLKKNGGFLAVIGQLPFPLKSTDDKDMGWLATAINSSTPAVVIATGDKKIHDVGTGGLELAGPLEVFVFIVSSNMRGAVAGRLASDAQAAADPSADPGIDAMLEQVMQLVAGQSLDLATVQTMTMTDEDHVDTEPDVTIWRQRYELGVEVTINPYRSAAPITSVEVDTNLDGADPANPIVKTITALEP